MSLSCECDYGFNEFSDDRIQKARKQHTCCECQSTINIGDNYNYTVGVWEGDFHIYKTCLPCKDVQDSLIALGFCLQFECLREDYIEYLREYAGINEPPENHLTRGFV